MTAFCECSRLTTCFLRSPWVRGAVSFAMKEGANSHKKEGSWIGQAMNNDEAWDSVRVGLNREELLRIFSAMAKEDAENEVIPLSDYSLSSLSLLHLLNATQGVGTSNPRAETRDTREMGGRYEWG